MMRAWSIPIGKYFGTEVRLHLIFFLLFALMVTQTTAKAGIPARWGVALFFVEFAAVLLHEAARALLSPKRDKLQRLVLLPIGGVIVGESERSGQHLSLAQEARAALAGPIANLIVAGIAALILLAAAPEIKIFASPYIHSGHLARSVVWINAGLGLLNLIPAYPLAMGRLLRVWLASHPSKKEVADPWQEATKRSLAYGQGFAMLLTLMGLFASNVWAMLIGFCVFVAAHIEDRSFIFQSVVSSVRMDEIMLTDFAVLSPADTLQDALEKALHTLQDDFPVVRSGDLVGTITRQKILDAVRSEGNGYVQSVMNRVIEVCQRGESLAAAFRKITVRGLTMIPVVDQQRLVGIVTLQNLSHNMALLAESRRLKKLDD